MKTKELIEKLKAECPREEDYLDNCAYMLHNILKGNREAESQCKGEINGMLTALKYRGIIDSKDAVTLFFYYSKERYAE